MSENLLKVMILKFVIFLQIVSQYIKQNKLYFDKNKKSKQDLVCLLEIIDISSFVQKLAKFKTKF